MVYALGKARKICFNVLGTLTLPLISSPGGRKESSSKKDTRAGNSSRGSPNGWADASFKQEARRNSKFVVGYRNEFFGSKVALNATYVDWFSVYLLSIYFYFIRSSFIVVEDEQKPTLKS